MSKSRLVGILVLTTVFMVGCSGSGGTKDEGGASVQDRDAGASSSGMGDSGASSSGASGIDQYDSLNLDDPESVLANRVVYFEFDSSQIKMEFQPTIAAHGAYLANHPDQTVTLEGHADERGSREYNIGLGERRALTVSRMLVIEGASSNQISVISYGEEKPDDFGHDEMAWSKNRRVEFVYAGH